MHRNYTANIKMLSFQNNMVTRFYVHNSPFCNGKQQKPTATSEPDERSTNQYRTTAENGIMIN